jgi:hypothetical protein
LTKPNLHLCSVVCVAQRLLFHVAFGVSRRHE